MTVRYRVVKLKCLVIWRSVRFDRQSISRKADCAECLRPLNFVNRLALSCHRKWQYRYSNRSAAVAMTISEFAVGRKRGLRFVSKFCTDFRCCGLLHRAVWCLATDASRRRIGTICKGASSPPLACVTVENGINTLCRNVGGQVSSCAV